MRDRRFVTIRRGGPLRPENHRKLILWAVACVNHVLPLSGKRTDTRIPYALATARAWAQGKVSTGNARKAAAAAHAAARESKDPAVVALARAAAHAAATAHMADHSVRAAEYALKAVKAGTGSDESERIWQDERLPQGIRNLVLSARNKKREL